MSGNNVFAPAVTPAIIKQAHQQAFGVHRILKFAWRRVVAEGRHVDQRIAHNIAAKPKRTLYNYLILNDILFIYQPCAMFCVRRR
jgi:hypothetical protein